MYSESVPGLKAPRDDGAVLAFPPLDEFGVLLADNVQRFATCRVEIAGRPLGDLRARCRQETLDLARTYLAAAGQPPADFTGDAILLAGHQPELFHPGVWLKNFALNGLARRHRAIPLNLIVDNDVAKSTAVRVPVDGRQVNVPFDASHRDVPFEERTVRDEDLFASLPARVKPLVKAWPFQPLLDEFWSAVLVHGARTPLLGERIAAARRFVERAWGVPSLELPLSWLCETEVFAWFAMHVLRDLPRFHAVHNDTLRAYRRRHGLRSNLHPVPDLTRDGDWLEAPFWIWRSGEAQRQRLWAHGHGDTIELRMGDNLWPGLTGSIATMAALWRQRAAAGCKLRTRALTTTLFTRMFLGDLFIHGIGGGKYDEVTDELFREFYGMPAPYFVILTGTALLPLPRFPQSAAESLNLSRLRRDIHWNPQRHLDDTSPAGAALAAEKQHWIDQPRTSHAERAERFQQLRRLTAALRPYADNEAERTRRRIPEIERQRQWHRVNSSREYAFCLFPETQLRELFRPFLS